MIGWMHFLGEITNNIVIVEPVSYKFNCDAKKYADARSAAFYAMGAALKTSKTVVLLTQGEFLSSVYTALTECWFQKAAVVVIALFEKVSDVKTQWMERCVISTLTVEVGEEELIHSFLKENIAPNGPVLLNIVGEHIAVEKKDYSFALSQIDEVCVQTFNGRNLETIPYKYKYGVISKYIGSSIIKDCGILMCTADCVLVDVNVFRTRYANPNMKIVVFDDGSLCNNNIHLWIQSNGWDCKVTESIKDLKWLCNSKKNAVLIVKEG